MPSRTPARTRRTPLLALALGATVALTGAAPSAASATGPSAAPQAPAPAVRPVLTDVDAGTVVRRGAVPAPPVTASRTARAAAAAAAPTSTWQVQFSGSMGGDATRTSRAQAAVQDAVATWAQLLSSPVPIEVEVSFEPTDPGVLGYTGASEHYGQVDETAPDTAYPSPLADALLGYDVAAGIPEARQSDLVVVLSNTEPDLYLGTDGRPAPGQIDLETVALHEIAHGLGFAGTMDVTADGVGHLWSSPAVFDTFPRVGGRSVLDLPNDSYELGQALTGGALTWSGPAAVQANGGRPVPLYAPEYWEPGSSYSHLDEGVFPQGGVDALLTPYLSVNEVVTSPGPVALGMLRDMGWQTAQVTSAIDERYAAQPGVRALLGAAVGTEQADGDVRWKEYERGRLYSSPSTGVHAVNGAILQSYLATGGHRVHGVPLTDETATLDGAARYNDFAAGISLYWTARTGVYDLRGLIRQAWVLAGGQRGPLGYPVSAERATPEGRGRVSDFSGAGGSVYWSPASGAHAVYGLVKQRWLQQGGTAGVLGFPVTTELAGVDGSRYNDFAGGSVYWTPSTGARAVYGAIRARWAELGGARVLGIPVTDERPAGDGVGRYNDFSRGATVTWSPATGAHEVHGLIREAWIATGGLTGPLGYPVNAESVAADGLGRYNDFSRAGGSVYWTAATGAHAVYGAIKQRWLALGGVRSYLRYPTSSEFAVPGGRKNTFQDGSITWTPSTGAVDQRP